MVKFIVTVSGDLNPVSDAKVYFSRLDSQSFRAPHLESLSLHAEIKSRSEQTCYI